MKYSNWLVMGIVINRGFLSPLLTGRTFLLVLLCSQWRSEGLLSDLGEKESRRAKSKVSYQSFCEITTPCRSPCSRNETLVTRIDGRRQ